LAGIWPMSYIVMLKMPGITREAFERVANDNADAMKGISDRSKEAGAIRHTFAEGDEGMVVIDEWDDPANFQRFFESEQESIGPLMQQAGATGEPEWHFYEKVDSPDAF
jgi:hypothetical protein